MACDHTSTNSVYFNCCNMNMLEIIKKLKMNQKKDRNSPLLLVPFLAPLQKSGIQICDCIEGIDTLQTIQPYQRLFCRLLG